MYSCMAVSWMLIILDSKIQYILKDVNNLHPLPIHINSWVLVWFFFLFSTSFFIFLFLTYFHFRSVEIQFRKFNTLPKKLKHGKFLFFNFISFVRQFLHFFCYSIQYIYLCMANSFSLNWSHLLCKHWMYIVHVNMTNTLSNRIWNFELNYVDNKAWLFIWTLLFDCISFERKIEIFSIY